MGQVCHIEDVLEREGVYVSTTVGASMRPMLRNRRDTIVVRPCQGRLHKYDVALYRRKDTYVLHRVVDVYPEGYLILGDNCLMSERVSDGQVIGVLTGFYRGDRPVDLQGVPYRTYARLWYALYPARRVFMRARGCQARRAPG